MTRLSFDTNLSLPSHLSHVAKLYLVWHERNLGYFQSLPPYRVLDLEILQKWAKYWAFEPILFLWPFAGISLNREFPLPERLRSILEATWNLCVMVSARRKGETKRYTTKFFWQYVCILNKTGFGCALTQSRIITLFWISFEMRLLYKFRFLISFEKSRSFEDWLNFKKHYVS